MPWTINYNPNHTLDQQELLAYCGPTTTSTYCGSEMQDGLERKLNREPCDKKLF